MENRKLQAFVSYSHRDDTLRSALDAHLSGLVSEGVLELWHDRAIEAGAEWEKDIQGRLEAADIVLLLISSDFMASPYCYGRETRRALERHEQGLSRVIPVILRPVDWHSAPFGKLQALPRDGRPVTTWPNQDEAFANVSVGLRAAAKSILSARQNDSDCPSTISADMPQSEALPDFRVGVKITQAKRETIKVTIQMLSLGTVVDCEIPLDATVASIIIELTRTLQLPRIRIDEEPVQWDLKSKHLGHLLDPRKTVRENNVADGDTLTFIRECVAG